MSDAVMTYNQFIESRRLMLGEEEFKKWSKVRRQLAYKSYLSISPFPRRRRKVDAESIYIDSEIAHNRRSAVTKEELSEEALIDFLYDYRNSDDKADFDYVHFDYVYLAKTISNRFSIPKAIVWPKPEVASIADSSYNKGVSFGHKEMLTRCKAAVEKARAQ